MRRIAAALLSIALLQAQTPKGEIDLTVTDPSGATMQAAGKIDGRIFQTDASGTYIFKDLPYGRHKIEVSGLGFATQSLNVEVHSATPVNTTVTLALAQTGSKVDVVATTPLAGVGLPIDEIPSPVQTATQADIEASGAPDLSDFLNRRLNGIHLNEMQGNPFMPDVNYRGYTASPLLGTPQGMSVFVDGVRQNQPFGDVVSWDLIPRNAISEVTLMPGSNPVFGLNTLGGALSIQTKDGTTSPGLSGDLLYGSSGRKSVDAAYGGGKAAGFNWFLAGTAFHESGWRVGSPSDIRQGFVRLGWRTDRTDLSLSTTYAYNTLTGNALQDYRLLAVNYASVYNIPDTTANRSPVFNFRAQHTFSGTLTFSGNVYYRNIRSEGYSANTNNTSFDQSIYQPNAADIAALTAAGYTGFPTSGANAANTPFPKWRCIAQSIEQNDPSDRCDAIIIYSKSEQNNYGLSGQLTWMTAPRFGHNQLIVGAAIDRGGVNFTQNTQYGYLNPNYRTTGINAWDAGSAVDLHGITPNWSLYATDTLSLGNKLNVTLSGRFNRNSINNKDLLNPGGGPGSLDGYDVFNRFNPSVGATYNLLPAVNAYASYTQGSRAPTSIELGCADPLNPCSLPNALTSDPALKQVVTDTWEAGFRGKTESHLNWDAGAFRAENNNDILFVSSVQTGSGYFKNFAKTRREGFQASVDDKVGRLTGGLDYTFLEATYQSTETVDGSGNNTSDIALSGYPGLDGNIYIHPGNRIPLIPKQTGKAYADIKATSKLTFDLNLVAASSSYARGNENNAYQSDGKYYLGPGVSPGYAVMNLLAHYDLNRRLQFVVQVDNLLDRHYYTAAQIANTGFSAQGTVLSRPFPVYTGAEAGNYPLQSVTFFAPGAPRRIWVELRLKW